VTLADFYQELFIIPILVLIVGINIWGSRANRSRAKQWAASHLPLLESEFASVGFDGRKGVKLSEGKVAGSAVSGSTDVPDDIIKEKSKDTYITYATGRQNIAWLDVKITLWPRYNPFKGLAELVLSFFFDTVAPPAERIEATAYAFDGKEKLLLQGGNASQSKESNFDGFVWAIVHKDKMNQLRQDRYDLSLTSTKDHAKLPDWCTVMTESAEVTEALLTPDLIKAVNDAGEDLESLIVSDQPVDAPKKYVYTPYLRGLCDADGKVTG
jgi:hypothetical protein